MIHKTTLKAAFTASLPVLTGYLTMGMAAGILLASRIPRPDIALWAFLTSAGSISGALQFALVEWTVRRTPLLDVALLRTNASAVGVHDVTQRGDTLTLSQSLLTAFDTTIAGLIAAAVATVISAVRKRWYARYMGQLGSVMECLLEAMDDEAA